MNWQNIIKQIEDSTGTAFKLVNVRPLPGGDINASYCLQGLDKAYFVKLNRSENLAMFVAEAQGLSELAASKTVRVPYPVTYGVSGSDAFLVLEYIEFVSSSRASDRLFGKQLALLHRQPQAFFGWQLDNTIGITPQPNTRHDDWIEFWRTNRLEHQLALAAEKGYRGHLQTNGALLCEKLFCFFDSYSPQAALLHGDLWGGNAAVDKQVNLLSSTPPVTTVTVRPILP